MKYRLGACALVLALAACSRGDGVAESGLANGNAARQPAGLLMKQAQPMARVSIASAPDRGALISYPDQGKPARREGAHTWYPAKISEAHAFNAIASGEMTLPLPDGSELKLKHERHPEGSDGNWTWIGRVEGGDPGQEAIITFGEKAVYGSIPQADGKPPLEIRTQGGSLWVVQADPSLLKKPNIGDRDMKLPPSRSGRQSAAAQTSTKASAASIPMAAAAAATGSTVDVVIGYTSGFRAARGGQSEAVTRLNYLVEVGNQAYSNSGVNGQLRLVGTLEVNYADNTDNETALEQLTGNTGSGKITVPAALQPIRDAREQYGADIAMFVRKFQTPENDGCGIAWLNGGNGTTIDPTMDDDFGFGVVSDGTDDNYFCADETLVHEASHLMGSAHDVGNAGGTPGAFPYSYGYKTTASTGNFYTVMAYGDTDQISYRVFSNPNITFCGTRACGVANQSDNARSLNQTIPIVATFRKSIASAAKIVLAGDFNGDGRADLVRVDDRIQVRMWLKSFGSSFTQKIPSANPDGWSLVDSGDFNGDGKADLVWYHSGTNALHYWLMNENGVIRYVNGGTLPSGYSPVAVKDFNGDGRSDIVITDGVTQVRLWTKKPSDDYFTDAQISGYPGANWRFAGAGDVDADGRSDLFWRNATTGELHYWLMNGSQVRSYNAGGTLDGAYSVQAIADLNGDGRSDVIWSNGANLRAWLKNASGTSFASSTFSSHPAGWSLVGAGDVDGDKKTDLFWYEQSTGTVDYWLMDGGAVRAFKRSQLTAGRYVPSVLADVSNDRRADIFWMNGVSDIRIWIKDQVGGYSSDTGLDLYPGGWNPVGAGDVDRDGKADLWWYQPSSRDLHYWLMNEAGIRSFNAAGTLDAGYTPRAIDDFNGDGRSDALISDGNTLRLMTKNAGSGFTSTVVSSYPAGWILAGTGDVDGDNKADLFWFNPTWGQLHYWLMDGATVRAFVDGGVMSAGYTPRAVGDFNGDGRFDVIAANGASVQMWVKNAANNGFTSTTFSAYPAGWTIFGAQDVNADGRDDLFWYHEASGTMDYWLMNGPTVSGYYRAGVMP